MLRIQSRQVSATSPAFNIPHLHLAPSLVVTPFEFCQDLWHPKTRVPRLLCGVVCMILHLVISVEDPLVTDGWTDTRCQLIPALASIVWVKTDKQRISCLRCSLCSHSRGTTWYCQILRRFSRCMVIRGRVNSDNVFLAVCVCFSS